MATPVSLLLPSQKCQGVIVFTNLSKLITFAAAPLVLAEFVRNRTRFFFFFLLISTLLLLLLVLVILLLFLLLFISGSLRFLDRRPSLLSAGLALSFLPPRSFGSKGVPTYHVYIYIYIYILYYYII